MPATEQTEADKWQWIALIFQSALSHVAMEQAETLDPRDINDFALKHLRSGMAIVSCFTETERAVNLEQLKKLSQQMTESL